MHSRFTSLDSGCALLVKRGRLWRQKEREIKTSSTLLSFINGISRSLFYNKWTKNGLPYPMPSYEQRLALGFYCFSFEGFFVRNLFNKHLFSLLNILLQKLSFICKKIRQDRDFNKQDLSYRDNKLGKWPSFSREQPWDSWYLSFSYLFFV